MLSEDFAGQPPPEPGEVPGARVVPGPAARSDFSEDQEDDSLECHNCGHAQEGIGDVGTGHEGLHTCQRCGASLRKKVGSPLPDLASDSSFGDLPGGEPSALPDEGMGFPAPQRAGRGRTVQSPRDRAVALAQFREIDAAIAGDHAVPLVLTEQMLDFGDEFMASDSSETDGEATVWERVSCLPPSHVAASQGGSATEPVPPAAEEVERGAAVMKQVREAREERKGAG